ncbi:MAG: hypothetical protein HQK83_12530 [Fibrobacteria bacterium]|nr:hypothetical protein [Fibrobacteria bacterium]
MPKPFIAAILFLFFMVACLLSNDYGLSEKKTLSGHYQQTFTPNVFKYKSDLAGYDFNKGFGKKTLVELSSTINVQKYISEADGFIWYDNFGKDDEIYFLKGDSAWHLKLDDINILIAGKKKQSHEDHIIVWDGVELRQLR